MHFDLTFTLKNVIFLPVKERRLVNAKIGWENTISNLFSEECSPYGFKMKCLRIGLLRKE